MRIMGVDASLTCTGVAIFDTEKDDFILVTKIATAKRKATPTQAKRAQEICIELSHLMFLYNVDLVVMEDIFVNPRNAKTSISLAKLRGAIESTAMDLDLEGVHVIPPTLVKQTVTGTGKADKEGMYTRIKQIYRQSKVLHGALGEKLVESGPGKNDDMADACCVIHAYLIDPNLAQIA